MNHAFSAPRTWLGLVAGAALAFGSATAIAGGAKSSSDMRPHTAAGDTAPSATSDSTGARSMAPADGSTHQSLKQLQTAQVHTGYVADANSLEEAKNHLQRAANCLVGPDSPDFQAAASDPCAGQGAIADSMDPHRVALAEEALSQIKAGLGAPTLSGAQTAAKEATDTLRTAVTGPMIDNE